MCSPELWILEAASLGPEELNPRTQSSVYMKLAKRMLLDMGRGCWGQARIMSKRERSKNSSNYKLVRGTTIPTIIRKCILK